MQFQVLYITEIKEDETTLIHFKVVFLNHVIL